MENFQSLRQKELVESATKSNIYFSQVREDPKIYESLLPLDLTNSVMIASGGDTVAYILGKYYKKISTLYVIDPNPAHIALTKLKIYLLKFNPEEKLKIMGHIPIISSRIGTTEKLSQSNEEDMSTNREMTVKNICKELNIDTEVFGTTIGDFSLDLSGRCEILFSFMRNYLAELGFDSENILKLDSENNLSKDNRFKKAFYESIKVSFDLNVLKALFSDNATIKCMEDFYEHLYEVTISYLSEHFIRESPFMSQFLVGKFLDGNYYDWYKLQPINDNLLSKIVFVNETVESFLLKNNEKMNFIHLSNITTCLDLGSVDKLIDLASKNLEDEGKVIMKILNANVAFSGCNFIINEPLEPMISGKSVFYKIIKCGKELNLAEKAELFDEIENECKEHIKLAQDVIKEINFFSSKLFVDITENNLDHGKFLRSQSKFFYAVDYFARPLCAFISRMDDYFVRKRFLENILEEHGNLYYENSHSSTFKKFLKSIGTDETILSEEVFAFNALLMQICLTEDFETVYGAFGMIEYLFIFISERIGKYVLENNWSRDGVIFHYSAHQIIDIKHTKDFFSLLSDSKLRCEKTRKSFIKGLKLGAFAFKSLYDRIY